MDKVDRAAIIAQEIAKCSPAHYKNEGKTIAAVYLKSESIGVIICQVAALVLEIEKLITENERLIRHQNEANR